ncbi:hypothetical protein D560_2824 [Bordetella holmesii ATCC 51541]|nr:hypothetical protein D560_2824 [Bordetella holmesii ATCC 51541]
MLACGRFYPPQARNPESRLRFYATRFGLVEADAAYYALPSASVTQRWAERTPPGFVFNIKAFRLFTGHQTPKRALPAALLRDMGWDPTILGRVSTTRSRPNGATNYGGSI